MKIESKLSVQLAQAALLSAILTLAVLPAQAQVTATWTGTAADGDWNNPNNWDQLIVPGVETNAVINGGSTVTYGTPMSAASFGSLTLGGALNINTNGFNVDGGATNLTPFTVAGGAVLTINAQGVASVANQTNANTLTGALLINPNGTLSMTNCGILSLAVGATLNVTNGVLTMTNSAGAASINIGPNGRNNGATAVFDHAAVTLDKVLNIQGGASSGNPVSMLTLIGGSLNCAGGSRVLNSTDDTSTRLVVDGGAVANLGAFVVQRTGPNGGLVLSNGVVNATSVQVGTAASRAYATIYGGVLTNTGLFTINDTTTSATSSDRRAQFLIRGGTVVSTGSGGIVIANQSNNGGSVSGSQIGGILDINAGTLTAEGITLIKDTTLTNAFARLNLTGSGAIYLGSLGLIANVGISNTAYALTLSGGTLGAKADWSSSVPLPLSGTVTFKAADSAGAAHDIALSGRVSGTGLLTKMGAGKLTLSATNNYTANTAINEGTLALSATGSISNTVQITVAGGATFDVSAVSGAALLGTQILGGNGSVNGSLAGLPGSSIRPGGLLAAGTLTFSNDLTAAGSTTISFDLSDDPTGTVKTNDFVKILGNLNLSGTNVVSINPLSGTPAPGMVFRLIQYGNNFNGGLSNLSLAGISGALSNDVAGKVIDLVVLSATRSPTSVTWLGGLGGNAWDTITTSNWLNGAVRDIFVTGDNARFDNTGATNPIVTIVGSVTPSALTVDTASNYVFSGSGSIDGAGGLTKTNTGTLSILATNNYAGATIIGGGTIEAAKLSPAGLSSSLGSAASGPENLQFFDSSLRYLGPSVSTDRGATFNGTAATVEVTNPSATLTLSGTLAGTGGLTKSGPGAVVLSGAGDYAGVTTVGNGTLQINNAVSALGTNSIVFAGGNLSLNVSGQPTYANALTMLTTGGLISAGGNNNIVTGPWSGAGTLNVSVASGTFTINGDMTTNFTGTIVVTTNSTGTFRLNAGGSDPSKGSAEATFDLGNSSVTFANRNGGTYGTTVYYLRGLAGGPSTSVRGSANTGSPNTYEIGDNNRSTTFAGVIANGAGGSSAVVSVLKAGTGTLSLSGVNTYSGATTISNGVLALSGSGSIGSTPTISVLTNTVLDVAGRSDGTLTLGSGQTVGGEGTIRGSVIAGSGSVVDPGPAAFLIGRLTITNSLTLQSGSSVNMELDYYNVSATGTNDEVVGLSAVTYGGTLNLSILSIETNAVFKLFSAGAYAGAFETISPPTPPTSIPGLVWDTSSLTVDGTLRVGPPRPGMSFVWQGSELIISVTNGMSGATFYVLASTNVALPVTQWVPIATNQFNLDGTFNFTNSVNVNTPRTFLTLQVP